MHSRPSITVSFSLLIISGSDFSLWEQAIPSLFLYPCGGVRVTVHRTVSSSNRTDSSRALKGILLSTITFLTIALHISLLHKWMESRGPTEGCGPTLDLVPWQCLGSLRSSGFLGLHHYFRVFYFCLEAVTLPPALPPVLLGSV